MIVSGMVWKYGDNVNTDNIFPGRYTYMTLSPEQLASHALEDLDPNFAPNAAPGDIIVAGKNWGCGSSREQAALSLKFKAVGAIIAESYARIFYRNSINAGLPIVICPQAVKLIEAGENIAVDFSKGVIFCNNGELAFPPYPSMFAVSSMPAGLSPTPNGCCQLWIKIKNAAFKYSKRNYKKSTKIHSYLWQTR